ncbi:hypothetical protein AGDE_14875 [Angomonas deanei]|uniref:TFIIS helical bundle-like domain containing protein, putative n=1 Tax=Angomonas deanei TaxID=59799 RepID=A0A7G2CHA9_9TRYP|nr:hypothetical protein AGDE_14875 [Angomonas deanei]CAD2218361.1 TFIIS helical bundle-like domain containing protein, putative [Angomonas deanei]|eukprot:EPY20065.1 hypothetical protein AGDE_14875 [Angomonas deanei]
MEEEDLLGIGVGNQPAEVEQEEDQFDNVLTLLDNPHLQSEAVDFGELKSGAPEEKESDSDREEDGLAEGGDPTNGETMTDEALLAVSDKKEAKKLGKKNYKRWKKLQKKQKKHSSDKHDKKKKSSKRKRDEDEHFNPAEMKMLGEESSPHGGASYRPTGSSRPVKLTGMKPVKVSAEEQKRLADMQAAAVMEKMKKASAADAQALRQGLPPLHRVSIVAEVRHQCARKMLVEHLVKRGILDQLCEWLYDFNAGRPSPLELRSAALDILLQFPLEGEVEEKEDDEKKQSILIDKYYGISLDELRRTDIGKAVNALRQQDELKENRSKCVQLLQRFSRVHRAGREQRGPKSSTVTWKCQRDPTVASPFEAVETSSEALAKKFMRPDPTDPTSYNRYLPWRPRAVVVTNLSGDLHERIQDGGDLNDEEDY